jgi:amino acid adenylation domain-containing protein
MNQLPKSDAVAIVGIGCRLPGGADSPAGFWRLLCDGVDAITELPPDRFEVDDVYDPDPEAPGKIYSRWGGFLERIDEFDADFFGISPREARRMDPQHRLLLETAWEALEDGGIVPERIGGTRTGVFIGISTHDYADLHVRPGHRNLLDAHINIGNALCAAANRISYLLDLHGPSMAVESACSSSLTAVHLACRSLQLEESELALAGGVNLVLAPELTIGFCKASMISPDGRCRAFDASANGYVRSEGAGVVVLKTLRRALEDGDPIHAVIRATAVNEDGRTPGISLPNGAAQELLLRQALAEAGIGPSAIQYVEAHGTGTAAGDPIEAGALGRVLGAGRSPDKPCLIGSAKTNVGHLEAGSGITGLIKAALCLQHRRIPPSLHFREPNPAIPFEDLRLRVPTKLEPWPETNGPAMAGVNSFGFGGSNAHAILEEPPPSAADGSARGPPPNLFTVSARTPDALRKYADRFANYLPQAGAPLEDVCFTAARRRTHHEHRLAVVGNDVGEMSRHLRSYLKGEDVPDVTAARAPREHEPCLAFAFSGMGPQWWCMGRTLLEEEPVYRQTLQECDALLRPIAGWSLLDELQRDEATSRIADADFAHVANCAMQIALAALWRSWGIVPDAVTGHSSGEIAAAHAAGALDLHDALFLAYHRGRLQHTLAGTGGMLAAAMSPEEATSVAARFNGLVSLAAVNSPNSVTLSGDADALQQIAATLEADSIFHRILQVEVPYHAPQMASIRDELLQVLEDLTPRPAVRPMVSSTTGDWIEDAELDAQHWWRNVREPVRFAPAVDRLLDEGCEIIVEVGPHPVLATYLTECIACRDASVDILPTLRRTENDRTVMLRTLGALHVRGRPVDWSGVYPAGACVPLPLYPWQRERYWFETPPGQPDARSAGVDTGHPLLGRRLALPDPVWEVDLDDPRTAYIDEHVVEDSIVFPGAGYVEMMIAGTRQLRQDGPIALEHIDFKKLLFLNKPHGAVLQLHHGRDGSLEIHGARKDDDAGWTLHATADLRRNERGHEPGAFDLKAIRKRCRHEMPVEEHFRSLENRAFRYGESFRGLREIRLGEHEALARIGWPDQASGRAAGYQAHPALLDAAFQVFAVTALAARQHAVPQGPLFPVGIDRVVFHSTPGESFLAHVVVRDVDAAHPTGDVLLADDAGNVCVACEGLRMKLLDEGHAESAPEAVDWLYELRWQNAPLHPAAAAAKERLNRPVATKKAVEATGSAPEEVPAVGQYYSVVEPALDRVARGFARSALEALDRTTGPSTAHGLVLPRYRRLLAAMIDMVGDPRDSADGPARKGASLHRLLDELIADAPEYAAEAELLRRGGEGLADILRGDLDVREVLLSEEGLALLSRMYHTSPACRSYHELIADTVAAAVSQEPGENQLRVLEIGAGTGAATTMALPRLPRPAEYMFTDISPYFVAQAREALGGHHPGLQFSVLDVEQDPVAQGFAAHSFDLVLAANVLHTTADLRSSLAHVRRLLAPGGILMLVELTRRAPWLNLVFGLLDGWWRFADTDIRPDYPLLNARQWRDLLEDSGFEDVSSIFDGGEQDRLQAVILARRTAAEQPAPSRQNASTWIVIEDNRGVADAVADRLRAAGHRCISARAGSRFGKTGEDVFEVSPDEPAQMARLLEEIRATGTAVDSVLHLRSLDSALEEGATSAQLLDAQRYGCESVLALTHALQETEHRPPEIWLVTSGAQSVNDDGAPSVEQATLWGAGRVLMNEHMDASCRLVDLGPAASADEVSLLVDELLAGGPDDEVALRGRSRFVRRMERVAPDQLPKRETRAPRSPDRDSIRLEIGAPGALDTLVLREAPAMEPGPGELVIRVRASGINFREVLQALDVLPECAGDDPANGMGVECAGVVIATGNGVEGFEKGDEVIALASPAHASHAVARAYLTVHKPESLSFAEAATVVNGFVTADYALSHIARLAPRERVLIHSATGAVGLAAIQLCRAVGAEVFATAGTPEKRAYLTALGVEHVMDSRSLAFFGEVMRDTGGEGVDVVVNSLTGEAMQQSLELLRPYGRFVELGKRDIYENARLGLNPFRRNLSYSAVDLMQLADDRPEVANLLLRQAVDRVANGTWTAVPHTAFDLAEAEQGFRLMAQARHIGKVVLTMEKPDYEVVLRDAPLCRPDVTYLITGGTGGFGLAAADWLVRRGARHLLLTSRSGLPKDGNGLLEQLHASSANIVIMRGDVSVEEDVTRVLDFVRREMPPLRGVIHAAMVLDDDVLARLDRQRFRKVLAPKVAGAWNVHRETLHDTLDFFVLFSSIASVIGHPMQGNYAAANAFLDALPAYRRARGLPGLAIGWGAVAGVGYVARHSDVSDHLDRSGFVSFQPEAALDALGELLRHDAGHLVAARVDWKQWADSNPVTAASTRFLSLTAADGQQPDLEGPPDAGAPLGLLRDATPEERPARIEAYLLRRVAKVLGTSPEKIDPERPLTELGFDSLMAVELITALKVDLGIKLPVVKILQGTSSRALSATLIDRLFTDAPPSPPDSPDPRPLRKEAVAHPLSSEQRRFWLLDRMEPGTPAYNLPAAARLRGRLDLASLTRSVSEVVRRHEVLRAAIRVRDGEPVQVHRPAQPLELPVEDLRAVTASDREAELSDRMAIEMQRPFDLGTGPLLRAKLFRLDEEEHVILLVVHHAAADAWSMNLLVREIAMLYDAFSEGRPSPLEDPPFRYADYVAQQQRRMGSDSEEAQLGYWKDRLRGASPSLNLPGLTGSEGVVRGGRVGLELSETLTDRLRAFAAREGVTLFMTLVAAFQALLHRYSGDEDISLGTAVSTREESGAEAVAGCFMNTVVLRTDLSGAPTFGEVLRSVREAALGAFEHSDVPFERVVEALRPPRDLRRLPLFQAMLVLHSARFPALRLETLEVMPVEVESGTAVADLMLLADPGERLSLTLEYSTDRLDADSALRLLRHLPVLLTAITEDEDQPITALPLMTDAERKEVLAGSSGPSVAFRERCLHELVEEQAARTPSAVAVLCGNQQLTYRELDAKAERLSRRLRRLGVGPEVVVGLLSGPSIETVEGLLGILKAGGAFLLLDPAYPQQRLTFMMREAGVSVLLMQRNPAVALPEHDAKVVWLDDTPDALESRSDLDQSPRVAPDDLAYVMYTSGSTGEPKGIMIPHRAITNQVLARRWIAPLSPADTVLQRTPVGFDPAIWEYFGPLAAGARLVITPPAEVKDTAALRHLISEQGVTVLQIVPSLLDMLLDEPQISNCRDLRCVFCGGEVLTPRLRDRFFEQFPDAELYNMYGPSEAAIDATSWRCQEEDNSPVVPIGRPIPNAQIYILDTAQQPVPVGVSGELCIAGMGLARGYLSRPELTAERFISNPFSDDPDARLYRTGDRARWLPEGTIEFIGRIDEQVKVRGFRVEPGEVEAALIQRPGIREVAVISRKTGSGDIRLVAFVTCDESVRPDVLLSALAERLPVYMLPSSILITERLPRLPSGKIDRAALAEMDDTAPPRSDAVVAPRDAVELQLRQLWEEFFEIRPIGVTDNFFDLGGHSLLAIRMLSRIRQTFGQQLPLASLVEHGSIEHLATLLHRRRHKAPSPLIPVQPRGDGPPFFCVHPSSGTSLCYVNLARALGDDRPFFAIQSLGLDGDEEPLTSIEDMASAYLRMLRGVQPEGPYLLSGWSMGAVVAYEMASQLEANGERLSQLFMLDPPPTSLSGDASDDDIASGLSSIAESLGIAPERLAVEAGSFNRLESDEQLARLLDVARRAHLAPGDMDLHRLRRHLDVHTANMAAMRAYQPRPFHGPVTIIKTASSSDPGDAWGRLAGENVTVAMMPGDHDSMLREPGVQMLARRIQSVLQSAPAKDVT